MYKNTVLFGFLALATAATACSVDQPSITKEQAIVGADEYVYFRCNATGWEANVSTQLQPTEDPYLFSLTYTVEEPWMVEYGDQCVFTVTDEEGGWGTTQEYFSAKDAPMTAPGAAQLELLEEPRNFDVAYEALGTYTITANWRDGFFFIESATGGSDASVACGDQACSISDGDSCCFTRLFEDAYSCVAVETCDGPTGFTTELRCDETADCPSGTACCASSTQGLSNTSCLETCADISAPIPSSQRKVCDPTLDECGSGTCEPGTGAFKDLSLCNLD